MCHMTLKTQYGHNIKHGQYLKSKTNKVASIERKNSEQFRIRGLFHTGRCVRHT